MNIPSFNALLDKKKLIRTVQELCEIVNSINTPQEENTEEDT
jgi:hypothetical protein